MMIFFMSSDAIFQDGEIKGGALLSFGKVLVHDMLAENDEYYVLPMLMSCMLCEA